MPTKDFAPRPDGADFDSVPHKNWLDALGLRQNIDLLNSVTTLSTADETYFFSVSAGRTYKGTVAKIVALGGQGTVTSVNISGANGINITGNPITNAGTIALSLGNISPTNVSTAAVTCAALAVMVGTVTSLITNSASNVGIGSSPDFDTSPTGNGQFPQFGVFTTQQTVQAVFFRASANATGPTNIFMKSRSTQIGVNTVLNSGDSLASINARGADGTNYPNAAAIVMQVDGTPGLADMPGRIVFQTTPDGSATLAEGFRLDSTQSIRTVSAIYPSAVGGGSLGISTTGYKAIYIDYTNTATVGNVTINKAAGRVNIGAGTGLITVSNSLVTANSHIFLNADSAPGNLVAVMFYAVAAAGSFTVNAVPAVVNQTAVDFFIVSSD